MAAPTRAPAALPGHRVDRDRWDGGRLRRNRRDARPAGRRQGPERPVRGRSRDPEPIQPRSTHRGSASTEPNVITIFGVDDVSGQASDHDGVPAGGGTLADRMSAARIPPALGACVARAGRAGPRFRARRGCGAPRSEAVEPVPGARAGRRSGCSRCSTSASRSSPKSDHARARAPGSILGTPEYMSPEGAVRRRGDRTRDRSVRGRSRRVRAALRPEALPRRDVRGRGRRARNSSDPGGDGLRPFAASGDRRRASSAALAKDPAERFRSCGELVASLQVGVRRERRHDGPNRRTRRRRPRHRGSRAALAARCRDDRARAGRASPPRSVLWRWSGVVLAAVVGRGRRRPPCRRPRSSERRRLRASRRCAP